MKRLHVHVGVADIAAAARFYTALFGTEPTVRQADYAKWMLDDPRVNFAISTRSGAVGLDHLGIQAETDDELAELRRRMQAAERPVLDQGATTCCYAKSSKAWTDDPAGLAWEAFRTTGEATTYGDGGAGGPKLRQELQSAAAACCSPAAA